MKPEQRSPDVPAAGVPGPDGPTSRSRSHAGSNSKKRHRRFLKKGLPAPVVFFLVSPLGVISMGALFVIGKYFIPGTVLICAVILWTLYVSDNQGFIRSKQMPRPHEPRRNYNAFEVLFLLGLVVVNLMLIAYILISR